jgi:hypothetical protein
MYTLLAFRSGLLKIGYDVNISELGAFGLVAHLAER